MTSLAIKPVKNALLIWGIVVLAIGLLSACIGQNPDADGQSTNEDQAHPFFVGNRVAANGARDDFLLYWNQVAPEFQGHWQSIESTRDSYQWQTLDVAYQFAEDNGLPFRGHALVGGLLTPAWVSVLNADDLAAEVDEWISEYCARYPNMQAITVVNESMPGHTSTKDLVRAFGDDWVVDVFTLARQHCPNITLLINDYNLLSTETDSFVAWVSPYVELGLIDAIGAAALGLEAVDADVISANLEKLGGLGVPIYITEWEVGEADDDKQRQILENQFPLIYQHPSVAGITFGGYVIGQSFYPGSGFVTPEGDLRPAMVWLLDYLNSYPRQ